MGGSLFDSLNAPAEAAADAIHAETWVYQPMRVPVNGDPVVDNTRPAIATLQAIWLDDPTRVEIGDSMARIASDTPKILVLASLFGANPPRKGDFFTRHDGIVYRATAVRDEGVARFSIDVVEAGV